MTKREQQKLDKRLENIAEKLLFEGWQYNQEIASENWLRLLEIMRDSCDKRINYLNEQKIKRNKE